MTRVTAIIVAYFAFAGTWCKPTTKPSAAHTWTKCNSRVAAQWHDAQFYTMIADHSRGVGYICSGVVRVDGSSSPPPSLLERFERENTLSSVFMSKILLEFSSQRNPRSICRAWNDDLYRRLTGITEAGVILQSAYIVWPNGEIDLSRLGEPETFPRPGGRAWLPPGIPSLVCEP